jgi:hypothetical protein
LGVWRCLGFNFIKLTAVGKLLVPRNVEKLAFFAVHPKTITSSEGWLNYSSGAVKTLHIAGHYFYNAINRYRFVRGKLL